MSRTCLCSSVRRTTVLTCVFIATGVILLLAFLGGARSSLTSFPASYQQDHIETKPDRESIVSTKDLLQPPKTLLATRIDPKTGTKEIPEASTFNLIGQGPWIEAGPLSNRKDAQEQRFQKSHRSRLPAEAFEEGAKRSRRLERRGPPGYPPPLRTPWLGPDEKYIDPARNPRELRSAPNNLETSGEYDGVAKWPLFGSADELSLRLLPHSGLTKLSARRRKSLERALKARDEHWRSKALQDIERGRKVPSEIRNVDLFRPDSAQSSSSTRSSPQIHDSLSSFTTAVTGVPSKLSSHEILKLTRGLREPETTIGKLHTSFALVATLPGPLAVMGRIDAKSCGADLTSFLAKLDLERQRIADLPAADKRQRGIPFDFEINPRPRQVLLVSPVDRNKFWRQDCRIKILNMIRTHLSSTPEETKYQIQGVDQMSHEHQLTITRNPHTRNPVSFLRLRDPSGETLQARRSQVHTIDRHSFSAKSTNGQSSLAADLSVQQPWLERSESDPTQDKEKPARLTSALKTLKLDNSGLTWPPERPPPPDLEHVGSPDVKYMLAGRGD